MSSKFDVQQVLFYVCGPDTAATVLATGSSHLAIFDGTRVWPRSGTRPSDAKTPDSVSDSHLTYSSLEDGLFLFLSFVTSLIPIRFV
jgi:hypothetical protein